MEAGVNYFLECYSDASTFPAFTVGDRIYKLHLRYVTRVLVDVQSNEQSFIGTGEHFGSEW